MPQNLTKDIICATLRRGRARLTLKIKIAIVALAASVTTASAQPNIFATSACSKAMEDVFRIDTEAFAKDINAVGQASKEDKAKYAFLTEYMALMKYTAANNKANYDAFFKASDAAFSAASGSKYRDNLESWLHIHKCMVYIYDGSLVSGGIQFWKSYRSFKSAESKYSGYEGQLPLRGIYNVIFSQIPEKWKSLAGFLGFGEGNTALGFKQIEQHRQQVGNTPGLRDEAVLFSFANMFFSFEQTLPSDLMDAIRTNEAPVVRYAYILSCGRSQNGEAADKALDETTDEMFDRFPLLIHQKGKYALRRLSADECILWANRFVSKYKGVSNKNGAYLEMTYAYRLKGDEAQAQKMVDKCLAIASDFDIDQRSHDEAQRAMDTPLAMLRARLQFEYGNFSESEQILKSFTPRQSDIAEWNFRMARAQDKQGEQQQALTFYDKTIAASANSQRFFGPYAAVHAAEIYVKWKNKQRATEYTTKARKLNNGEYKKELDQRIELTERAIKKL